MIYFSKSTLGFYRTDLHGSNMPSDVVEITEAEYAALLAAQAAGKMIQADMQGRPQAVERIVTAEETAANLRAQAQVALEESNSTILRCFENAIAVPPDWRAYRNDLRAIVSGTSAATELPPRPDYPAGT